MFWGHVRSNKIWAGLLDCLDVYWIQTIDKDRHSANSSHETSIPRGSGVLYSAHTGCPTSYRIVIGSKLRFSRQIGKFKENESVKKTYTAIVTNFLQKMLGFLSIMCVFLSLKCRDNPI